MRKRFKKCPICSFGKEKGNGCSFCNEKGRVSIKRHLQYVSSFKKNRKDNIIHL